MAAAARSEGYRYRPRLDFRDPALGRVLLLMGPGTIGMAATQINVLVNTQFASSQGTGAISWLDYAFRVMYLPIGLFGVSVAAASTPALSRLAATNNTAADAIDCRVRDRPDAGAQSAGDAGVDRARIADRVDSSSNTEASPRRIPRRPRCALQFYALGLVGYSVVRIVSPAFYALRMSRIPVIARASRRLSRIVLLNVVLVRVMGYAGLALGTSLAAIVNAAVQIVLLRRRSGHRSGQAGVTTVKMLMAPRLAMVAWLV